MNAPTGAATSAVDAGALPATGGLSASEQDGSYPRPLLVRKQWASLDGAWDYRADPEDAGLRERWFALGVGFDETIRVPFPPESSASGIGRTEPVVIWYRRILDASVLVGDRMRHIVHFGAVDHSARVWVDGRLVAEHHGGQTAFAVDITDDLDPDRTEHELVVRAFDPVDPELPRGKQDWQSEPHLIWYRRSSGIWRTVWIESVASQRIQSLHWATDVASATVTASIVLAQTPTPGTALSLRLQHAGRVLAEVTWTPVDARSQISVELPDLRNAQAREALLWSPEHPTLVDAAVGVSVAHDVVDAVASYVGIRSAAVGMGSFLLNGVPYFVRSVLEQGWWDASHFTPPNVAALRSEVELIRSLGFNAVRVHQKTEDPRFLFWADRLGLLVWGETAGAYAFGPRAIPALVGEWHESSTETTPRSSPGCPSTRAGVRKTCTPVLRSAHSSRR